jgi:aminodeoxyfutalosine deaminase
VLVHCSDVSLFRADQLFTMTDDLGVISDGCVAVRRVDSKGCCQILEVGSYATVRRSHRAAPMFDCRPGFICPGLVNCHTHLLLSNMRGRLPKGKGFTAWLESMAALDATRPSLAASAEVIRSMVANGVALCVDFCNRKVSTLLDCLSCCPRPAVFVALQIFDGQRLCDTIRTFDEVNADPRAEGCSLACHSLYAQQGEDIQSIHTFDVEHGAPFFLHLAESPDEVRHIQHGVGPLTTLLAKLGIEGSGDRGCTPVEYALSLGLLDDGTFAIHCSSLTKRDVEILAENRVNCVVCLNSNRYIGVPPAPIGELMDAGVNVCVGSDSYASNDRQDLWGELRAIAASATGRIELLDLLRIGTTNPASKLGVLGYSGTIRPGGISALATVPPDIVKLFDA